MKKIKIVRDLKSQVYKSIKEWILTSRPRPGTQLKEDDLVNRLGVSRTPIREVLNQLSKEGVVEIIPHKGAFIKRWTHEEVVELHMLREVIEGLASRLATKYLDIQSIEQLETLFNEYRKNPRDYAKIDEQFHNKILQACGSTKLIGLIESLNDTLHMLNLRAVIFKYPSRIEESLSEHVKIIRAFKSGDEDLAEKLTREHLQGTRSYYISHLNGGIIEDPEMDTEGRIRDILMNKRIHFESIGYNISLDLIDAAKVLGIRPSQIIRTVVLKTRIGRFCALSLPYDKQFEKELVTKKLKIKDVRFPSSEEVQKLVGCEIGYVPPFGQIAHLSLYFDRDLLRETHLFFTPGIAGKFFKFNSIDLRNLYNPMLV